ncbi:unnamed protein product [Penicillium manginii]
MTPAFEDTSYGVSVKDGTVDGKKKQKLFNAYCKRTDSKGMKPAAWNVRYNMGKCLVHFANSASSGSSSGASKGGTPLGKWGELEIESIEYVDDIDEDDLL